uniref:Uncharacterized protein n=1 Tax=Setaria digitata TaxID=48799 RepID=A0A915PTD9_9BILA
MKVCGSECEGRNASVAVWKEEEVWMIRSHPELASIKDILEVTVEAEIFAQCSVPAWNTPPFYTLTFLGYPCILTPALMGKVLRAESFEGH